jgi:hypothetical protein
MIFFCEKNVEREKKVRKKQDQRMKWPVVGVGEWEFFRILNSSWYEGWKRVLCVSGVQKAGGKWWNWVKKYMFGFQVHVKAFNSLHWKVCKSKMVFIGGLSAELTEMDVENFFFQFGNVIKAVIVYFDEKHRKSRGEKYFCSGQSGGVFFCWGYELQDVWVLVFIVYLYCETLQKHWSEKCMGVVFGSMRRS